MKERKWMKKIGKASLLDFTDGEIQKMKECFNTLDEDGSGAIGIDELEGPLIGLGFVDTREEIEEMIDKIDDDGSGEIEFNEFLVLLKHTEKGAGDTSLIKQFFKDLTSGIIGEEDLSFNMVYYNIRRQNMK